MKKEGNSFGKIGVFVLSVVLLAAFSSSALAGSHYKYAINPGIDIYFGHISYIENKESQPIVFKEDQISPEFGVLNYPVAPGNTIRTESNGRCEVQFDTGTILRLEENTEIKLETVLAQSLSSRKKLTNLVLNKGQVYLMYRDYMSLELFQIMTPNAALNMDNNSVALVKINEDGSTDISVMEGKASVLYGPDENSLSQENIKKSRIMRIGKNHKLNYLEDSQSPDFELWNQGINKNFEELHEGQSALPKPLHRYPEAVIYFEKKYGSLYGEWLWDDFCGYVWKPYVHRYYPSGWHPYYYGQWTSVNGQMFWIPEEPWGWVPYHLGTWIWNKKKGWVWIPGDAFAPAWVCWNYVVHTGMYTGYFAWRPWTVMDWLDWRIVDSPWTHAPGDGDVYNQFPDSNLRKLSKKKSPPYVLTGNLKKVFKNVKKGLEQGEKDLLYSYSYLRSNISLVKHEWIISPNVQTKIISWNELGKDAEEALSRLNQDELHKKIVEAYRVIKSPESLKNDDKPETKLNSKASAKNLYSQPASRNALSEKQSHSLRFRDWNPDVKTAREMGVSIIYSGGKNEISCPELKLSSGNVRISPLSRISSGNGFYSSLEGEGSISGRTGSSSSGSKSSTTLTSRTSSSTGKSSKTEKK
ncbi:MAG: DUF6600 domain-containing protein [Candidatus Aminicenantes bacterium]